jgi:hypothetical protein
MARNEGKYGHIAEKSHASIAAEKLRVSLEYLDWDYPDIFFVHGLEPDHYKKLFECMAELGRSTEAEILEQKHYSLTPKSIFNNNKATVSCFPIRIKESIRRQLEGPHPDVGVDYDALAHDAINRAFEVRIAKSYGRLHGFVWNKAFYVVWFDPAHNLYPRKDDGVRNPVEYATVRGFAPDDMNILKEENRLLVDAMNELKKENEELLEAFANL